jgi:hypothetical protein
LPNNLRAEIAIELGGVNYNLRPTFNALCEIEEASNTSVINLLISFDQRGIFLKEVVAIIKAGIRGANGKVPKNLIELIQKKGFSQVLPLICQFLKTGLNL